MGNITKFEYKGINISFEFSDGSKMINATEMAKPFNKPVGNFLRLSETKKYVQLLERRYSHLNIAPKREVLRVVKGGDARDGLQGTWMDEKLALKFASWLSHEFELWVYDRIFELLTTGKTEISQHPTTNIIQGIRLIADQLERHDKEIGDIKEDIGEIKSHVADLEAKVISIDENYYSVSGYCSLNHIPCPLHKAQSWGLAASKLSRQKNMPTGEAYDAKYGNVKTYHIDILKEVVKHP